MKGLRESVLALAVALAAVLAMVLAASAPKAMASEGLTGKTAVSQGTSVRTPAVTPQIIFPSCGAPNDGAYWRSPTGILYQCRYVSGLGYRWVPVVGGCMPGVTSYGRETSASLAAC